MASLKIRGVQMPPIASLHESDEKIWSDSTGRVNTGEMTGVIVALKKKYEIKFIPLKEEQIEVIRSAVNSIASPFFSVELVKNSGVTKTFTAYAGDFNYNLGWDAVIDGSIRTRYDDVSLHLIEK